MGPPGGCKTAWATLSTVAVRSAQSDDLYVNRVRVGNVIDRSRIETVLFDFGGTLDAPGVHWLTRFYALYPQAGLMVEPEHIKAAFYWADAELQAHPNVTRLTFLPMMQAHVALQLQYLDLPLEPYQRYLAEAFWRTAAASLQASVRVLRVLHDRYALGVISNFYGNVAALCEECGLAELCAVIIDSAQVSVRKPDPRIFSLALAPLGCAPHTAVYVGDSFERDMVTAKTAGLQTIWLRGPEPRPCPDPSMVDATITTLEELPGLLTSAPV
jgi:HAD superfamily hydrolase (TIGR01509 family)